MVALGATAGIDEPIATTISIVLRKAGQLGGCGVAAKAAASVTSSTSNTERMSHALSPIWVTR